MQNERKISRFLSYVLRHKPDAIDLQLDACGWANIDVLLGQAARHGTPIRRDELETVVANNDKQRFSIDRDGNRIRANQGHSTAVDLALPAVVPPDRLYHGTAWCFTEAILAEGLKPGRRRHVHLSQDADAAISVGRRHGRPVVLNIDARRMHDNGLVFYRSENGVWLTHSVPVRYFHIAPDMTYD